MAAVKYDMIRLAEMRDAHITTVDAYKASVSAVNAAASEAARARFEAPPLPGIAPVELRHAFADGIGSPPKPAAPRARTNEFYLQPLATLLAVTQEQLDTAGVDQRALSRVIVAENKLAKLRSAHATKAAAVHASADAIKSINLFAEINRL